MFDYLYRTFPVFKANIIFLSQVRLTSVLRALIDDIEREKLIMTDFATDEARLEADTAAEGELIDQVQATTTANTAEIETLKAEISTLQSQGTDTTAMEAALATLEANNTKLAATLPATGDTAPTAGIAATTQMGADGTPDGSAAPAKTD